MENIDRNNGNPDGALNEFKALMEMGSKLLAFTIVILVIAAIVTLLGLLNKKIEIAGGGIWTGIICFFIISFLTKKDIKRKKSDAGEICSKYDLSPEQAVELLSGELDNKAWLLMTAAWGDEKGKVSEMIKEYKSKLDRQKEEAAKEKMTRQIEESKKCPKCGTDNPLMKEISKLERIAKGAGKAFLGAGVGSVLGSPLVGQGGLYVGWKDGYSRSHAYQCRKCGNVWPVMYMEASGETPAPQDETDATE